MYVCMRCVAALLVMLAVARAEGNVSVVWQQLTFEDTHQLVVNSSVEYILPFAPSVDQSFWPVRLWIRTDGGDSARPLLVTARRRIGATTWQLPYRFGDAILYELERTLCPDDSVQVDTLSDDCEDPSMLVPGEFSLHIGSSCAASVHVQLRASFARDWLLPFEATAVVDTLQGAPRVHYYRFQPEQENVRLIVASEDDVCSIIAVQNYTCPISETLEDVQMSTLRMTVQRSGGMQLSRSRYPHGFYVVSLVSESDAACRKEEPPGDPWLWEAAVLAAAHRHRSATPPPPRGKRLTITTKAALSRWQYFVGASVTLVVFTVFYLMFGALVLAQRLPRWKRLVGPRAVLANQYKLDDGARSELESAMSVAPPRRRRRDSTATFDSSDNSNTDDEEQETGTAITVVAAGVTDTLTNTSAPTNGSSGNDVIIVTTRDTRHNTDSDATDTVIVHTNTIVPTNLSSDNDVTTASARDAPHNTDIVTAPTSVCGDATAPDVSANNQNSENIGNTERVAIDQDAPTTNGSHVINYNEDQMRPRPFGLPARLHVAALARRRAGVLAARSDRYLYTLYTVGLFYALPVVQFVAAFQLILNVSGSLDICYYNFLCAHPVGAVSDFNHVFSNVGYLLLGALFMLQVRRRNIRRLRKPRNEEYGIPAHYGLLSSLGAAMMMVALLSATYHICPNGLNFQFDTAFMYVLAVLSMVKIYQSRHPDINARAHATFGVLAVLIALVVWGVLGGGPLFWSLFTVLHVFTFLLLSVRIYYVGQFRLEKESLQMAARELAALPMQGLRPLYTPRLVMLLIANAVNWGFALYGLFTQSGDFASHLLSVLLCNALLYMVFYMSMKLLHGERPRWYVWAYLGAAAAAWAPALYLFVSGSTDWSTTPALSRHQNHECRVLQFYDSHDLWHMMSAVALYFTFNALLTWDDGLAAVKRTEIAVF